MTYRVIDRQQAAMIVPIPKIYRYFAACQHVSGSSVIQVCIRYGGMVDLNRPVTGERGYAGT